VNKGLKKLLFWCALIIGGMMLCCDFEWQSGARQSGSRRTLGDYFDERDKQEREECLRRLRKARREAGRGR
jgi:hypothetical protein